MIQLIRKFVGILLTEGCRSFGHFTAISNLLHQIPNREALFDIMNTVKLSTMVYGMGIFCDDPVGQWNVRGDDKISFFNHLNNAVVRFIRS